MASTVSLPPLMRLTTPSGSPVCSSRRNTFCIVSGTFSEGLTSIVFPQAMAYGRNQKVIIPGKLKGAMTAHTPTGCRIMNSSMPVAISSRFVPCMSVGMPQATSTFSMARRISPFASSSVFPHSSVIVRAMSSKFSSSRFFNLKRYWIRWTGGVRRQLSNAAVAAAAA